LSNRAKRKIQQQRKKRLKIAAYITLLVAILIIILVAVLTISGPTKPSTIALNQSAVNASFYNESGDSVDLNSLRGHGFLLWLVTTWCSSCQAGTQAMAQYIEDFQKFNVTVYELELYNDLGQNGPSMNAFIGQFASKSAHNPDWKFGQASLKLSQLYDPNGYLDIYYLISPSFKVAYINSSPGSTMNQLLASVSSL
jgi:thiol-disulfide isomerase/thioredoxin